MLNRHIKKDLTFLYGDEVAKDTYKKLQNILLEFNAKQIKQKDNLWDQKDNILIAYPDSFTEKDNSSLKTLNKFLNTHIKNYFNTVHILPFAPYSSDRGFSVIDYTKVHNKFGTWKDIAEIEKNYKVMADLVCNHVSAKSFWFKEFLKGNKKYENYFIWFTKDNLPSENLLKKIRRGRATSVLTPFTTARGVKYLWTTYSVGDTSDQIDLNYKNPDILIEIIKVYLLYVKNGISLFRFDGIGSLWKKLGTSCKHLPEAHRIISILKKVTNSVNPNIPILTETTTASMDELFSYLGNEEANIVYNFPLAPLLLLSIYKGSSEYLTNYISEIKLKSKNTTILNILDVHDGINMYTASKFVRQIDLDDMYKKISDRGGKFSYRSLPDGTKAVKELNITWWSALNGGEEGGFELEIRKFIMTRALAMSLKGIPAIYYMSLFGASNDLKAYKKSNHSRDVNRTSFDYSKLNKTLLDVNSKESLVFKSLKELIKKKNKLRVFSPSAKQEILKIDKRLFALIRSKGKDKLLAIYNISNEIVSIVYKGNKISLKPYDYIWKKI